MIVLQRTGGLWVAAIEAATTIFLVLDVAVNDSLLAEKASFA